MNRIYSGHNRRTKLTIYRLPKAEFVVPFRRPPDEVREGIERCKSLTGDVMADYDEIAQEIEQEERERVEVQRAERQIKRDVAILVAAIIASVAAWVAVIYFFAK